MSTITTDATITAIITALADLGPRISAGSSARAQNLAADILRPLVPAGLWAWSVKPAARESVRAYARRAVRYLIARCATAGVACTLRHEGAETLASSAAYARRRRHHAGERLVHLAERTAASHEAA